MMGGDSYLEELQRHTSTKIANFASEIIETYYSDRLEEQTPQMNQ